MSLVKFIWRRCWQLPQFPLPFYRKVGPYLLLQQITIDYCFHCVIKMLSILLTGIPSYLMPGFEITKKLNYRKSFSYMATFELVLVLNIRSGAKIWYLPCLQWEFFRSTAILSYRQERLFRKCSQNGQYALQSL